MSDEKHETPPERAIDLASGRRLEIEARDEGDWVLIRGRDGVCVLTVLITDQGPVLRFDGAALQLAARESVEITCKNFRVSAENKLSLDARSVEVRSHLGGVKIEADDDVAIDGERVLLNSSDGPQQLSWDEYLAKQGPGD